MGNASIDLIPHFIIRSRNISDILTDSHMFSTNLTICRRVILYYILSKRPWLVGFSDSMERTSRTSGNTNVKKGNNTLGWSCLSISSKPPLLMCIVLFFYVSTQFSPWKDLFCIWMRLIHYSAENEEKFWTFSPLNEISYRQRHSRVCEKTKTTLYNFKMNYEWLFYRGINFEPSPKYIQY